MDKIDMDQPTGNETAPESLRKYLDDIKSIKALSLLDSSDLEYVFATSKVTEMPAETSIVEQGDIGDSVIVLLAGNAAAIYTDKYGNQRYLTKFKKGDFFGERGFFREAIRNASIYTVTPATIIELKADLLKKLMRRYPKLYDLIYSRMEDREKNFRLRVVNYLKLVKEREMRKNVEGEVKFQLAGLDVKDSEPHFGFIKDFSSSGCLIEMDGNAFLKHQSDIIGRRIPLAIKLEKVRGIISAVGKVCWYGQASGMDVMGYRVFFGVQFIKLFGDSLKLVTGLGLQSKTFNRKS
ncbi:MAG: cyclic nucleotide-binding domain-containing protein [Nitrospinota bacterium]